MIIRQFVYECDIIGCNASHSVAVVGKNQPVLLPKGWIILPDPAYVDNSGDKIICPDHGIRFKSKPVDWGRP